ncbi:MAG: VIT domain-containing protein [Gemmatimonadales bacterium]
MFRTTLLAAVLALGAAETVHAQGWVDVERRPGIAPTPVVRVSSTVRTRVEGRVATIEVEEQFRNSGGGIAEGTYLYPLPGEAVFQNFSLWMGENEMHGEMMNVEQARGVYEEIVRRLRDPALLTLEGHGLVRARIFPIQPGETRRVVLRYTQMLQREGDALRLRYAIGDRGPAQAAVPGTPAGWAADRFSFRVNVPDAEAYGTPYSPTHRITTRTEGGAMTIALDSNATGDVELFLPLRRGLVGTSVMANAPGGEDGYFMLLISPARADEAAALPRDLTLVVDISGSMSGDKIEQAKAALRQALSTLGANDRFRLISFSNRVTNFRDGFSPATSGNLDAARHFVDGLVADGGTNIAGALDAALSSTVAEDRLPIVVFMTDGVPTVGEQSPERLAQEAGAHIGRARIFTLGIGQDVNTYLLDRLAQEGRGTAEYVAPEANVEQPIGSLMAKIRHPALTNLQVVNAPVELVQTYPSRLPDVFFGEELVIFGRYHGTGRGTITVTGQRGNHTETFTADAVFPASETGNAFIPRLWASRRIGELTRQVRIEGATPSLVGEIRDLGLRYGILTEYTSYLVQEPIPIARRLNMPMPAMSPTMQGGAGHAEQQTGLDAMRAARSSAALMGAGNLASADAAAKSRLDELTEGRASGPASVRHVGGKLFVEQSGVWTDAAHQASFHVYEVAPFSAAYFELVHALPELAPCLGIGDQILIAGRRASIKVTAGGMTAWPAGELLAAVRAYRGA